jgi:hypothetical protein
VLLDVRRFALYLFGDATLADDLVSEVFVRGVDGQSLTGTSLAFKCPTQTRICTPNPPEIRL